MKYCKSQILEYTFIRIRMMFKNIEVHGSNSIEGSCFPPVESWVWVSAESDSQMKSPDSGVNTSDDSYETWIFAESEFNNLNDDSIYAETCEELLNSGHDSESPVPEPLDSGVNMSDDSCETWISAESVI